MSTPGRYPPPPPPPTELCSDTSDPMTATIDVVRTSWCTWDVLIHHGLMQYGPDGHAWLVVGTRNHALWVAARKLDRYRRRLVATRERQQQRTTLR